MMNMNQEFLHTSKMSETSSTEKSRGRCKLCPRKDDKKQISNAQYSNHFHAMNINKKSEFV